MIQTNKVVSFDYILKDGEGQILDTSENGLMTYLHGRGALPDILEEQLGGKEPGQQVLVTLTPEQAYGDHNAELVQVVGPEMFGEGEMIQAGMVFQNETENGPGFIQVIEVKDKKITIDGNHPYAGKTLVWDIVVLSVRKADDEEIARGYALNMQSENAGKICATTGEICEGKGDCDDKTDACESHEHHEGCSHKH